jgi:hypothetical protein
MDVRIIETHSNEGIKTKMLFIQLPSRSDIQLLFIPKLENIGFTNIDCEIMVTLKNPLIREFFNDWILKFHDKLISIRSVNEFIDSFNQEIKSLMLLGKKAKKLPLQAAKGLYAELLVVKKMIEENVHTQEEILESWHRPEPSNHDFDFSNFSIEVKSTGRESTTIKISSENQLSEYENLPLYLYLFIIDHNQKKQIDSIGTLYMEIKFLLETKHVNNFEMKCASDSFFSYLGPELMPLDYKFNLIEFQEYYVDQIQFPRIRRESIENGISKVSYQIDISAINKFKKL